MKKPLPDDKVAIKRYSDLLADIKSRIRQAQNRAVMSANAEMLRLYWDIGRMVAERQGLVGWGKGLLRRLANDLKNELPVIKGFSERNIKLLREKPLEAGVDPQFAVLDPTADQVLRDAGMRPCTLVDEQGGRVMIRGGRTISGDQIHISECH